MKNFKRNLISAIAMTATVAAAAGLFACHSEVELPQERSELIGAFESSSSVNVVLTNDSGKVDDGSNNVYMYTSDVYPLNTIENEGDVRYISYQKLRLKRDYTYEYTLEILLRKVTDQSNVDLAKLECSTSGTFDYRQNAGENYTVTLSDPVSGSEKRYGSFITGENNVYSWRMSSSPNFELDVAALAASDDPVFDRYVKGGDMSVEKSGTDRLLYNDVFYDDFLVDVADYCSFDYSAVPSDPSKDDPAPPDRPDPPIDERESMRAELPKKRFGDNSVALAVTDAGYSVCVYASSAATSVEIGGATVTDGVSVNDATKKFERVVSTNGAPTRVTVGGSDFDVKAYLTELCGCAATTVEEKAVARVAASVLDALGELAPEYAALIFESVGNNKYHADFGARDNLTITNADGAASGFAWRGVPTLDGDALAFAFEVSDGAHGSLRAEVEIRGEKRELKPTASVDAYVVTVPLLPFELSETINVTVYDGNTRISSTAGYSATRAAAWLDINGNDAQKRRAKTVYSLAKSLAWLADENVVYSYDPAVNKSGEYRFSIGEFSYSEPVAATEVAAFGTHVYIGGVLISDTVSEYAGDGWSAKKEGGDFTVELDGAHIDGIGFRDTGAAPVGTVTIIVKSDSTLENILIPCFGDTVAATIRQNCAVVIRSETGAKLTVKGNIHAGDLTIDGARVEVSTYSPTDSDGVVCGKLDVSSGSIAVRYTGRETCGKSGVLAKSDVTVGTDGKLSIDGFKYGLYLNGDTEQTLTVRGALDVSATAYGITGSDGGANRKMNFLGGKTTVKVVDPEGMENTAGISLGDITVGDAELEITVDTRRGAGIEAVRPVTFATISGSAERGRVTVVNKSSDDWGDHNYAVRVENMTVDGGVVRLFAMNKNGVIFTERGATVDVRNGDLHIENGQDLSKSYGRGINAQSGDEAITVESSAVVVFKNCDAAVGCWAKGDGESFARFVNYGLVIVDGYKIGVDGTRYDSTLGIVSWEMRHTVENNGRISYTNFVG